MSGTLFVVATPIGNLEDLTFRALRTLREVDLIAAEDTRRTSKLLAHYEVRKPLVSLREHNEAKQGARLVDSLQQGTTIALVTDAGTPGIADPGARFVRLARQRLIKVVPIPGCSAVTAALSASGVEASQFVFAGFAPAGERLAGWSDDLLSDPRTTVFYATPHGIIRTLSTISAKSVKRPIIVWRELTKSFEESIAISSDGEPQEVAARGEFTVVVGAVTDGPDTKILDPGSVSEAADLYGYLTKFPGLSRDSAIDMVALRYGSSSSATRKAIKKHGILVKQQKHDVS